MLQYQRWHIHDICDVVYIRELQQFVHCVLCSCLAGISTDAYFVKMFHQHACIFS